MNRAGNVERCLQELGYALVPTKGPSMWPLLREGKSLVQLTAREGRPIKAGDVVLYRAEDGKLILHRVIQVLQEDMYLLCGDHQWRPEEQVSDGQILAVAHQFIRNGHCVDDRTWWYGLYKILWNSNMTVRRICLGILRLTGLEKRSLQL